jgi:hypothetical protein
MKSSGILVVLLLSVLTAMQSAVFADSQTLTFQDGDGGAYSSTQGAFVNTLFGAGDGFGSILVTHSTVDLYVNLAFVRFPDIIGDNPGQIPPGSTIESASLDLTRSNDSAHVANLRLVNGAWDESTITSENYPGTSVSAGYILAGPGGNHYVANITAAVQAWASGTENWGVDIEPGVSETSVDQRFYSDDTGIVSYRPLLTVTFTPPNANPVDPTSWGRIKALYQ